VVAEVEVADVVGEGPAPAIKKRILWISKLLVVVGAGIVDAARETQAIKKRILWISKLLVVVGAGIVDAARETQAIKKLATRRTIRLQSSEIIYYLGTSACRAHRIRRIRSNPKNSQGNFTQSKCIDRRLP